MLEKFCCFRLESTAKFFAWLGIVGSVLLISISIFGIVNARDVSINIQKHGLHVSESDIKVFFTIYIVLCVINGAASICLLLGTIQKRHSLILPWLIISAIGMLLSIVFMFYTGSFSSILGLALNIYIWLAMFSLYKKIKIENETGTYPSHAEYMPKHIA